MKDDWLTAKPLPIAVQQECEAICGSAAMFDKLDPERKERVVRAAHGSPVALAEAEAYAAAKGLAATS